MSKLKDVTHIVLPWKRLTPKRAAEWLGGSGQGLADLLSEVTPLATSREDRSAIGLLAWELSRVMEACAGCIASGRPVKVEQCDDMGLVESPLRVAALAFDLVECQLTPAAARAAKDLVAQARATIERQVKRDSAKTWKAVERWRKLDAPGAQVQALTSEIQAVRDELCDALNAVEEPWRERLRHLEYERELLLQVGDETPGPAPDGWRPVAASLVLRNLEAAKREGREDTA